MKLDKVKGPGKDERQAMYYAEQQEFVYRHQGYDYLESIAMTPRMAAISGYITHLEAKSVLDVGCGTGFLLEFLPASVAYTGVDISTSAVKTAQERFAQRENASFEVADFRQWDAPEKAFDAIVWAGIGKAWTIGGRKGNAIDWLDILSLAERGLRPSGFIILEVVTAHWPKLERMIQGSYTYVAGCDLNCFQSEESPKRSIRIFQKEQDEVNLFASQYPTNLLMRTQIVRYLADLGKRMGQLVDVEADNIGYGFLYYALTRIYRPETVVCIGSYRGFSPVCFTLGLVDNRQGFCHFIDPGKVDKYWHKDKTVPNLTQTFGLHGYWCHLHKTSQQAIADKDIQEPIDILLIDGDHTYKGVKYDFDHFAPKVRVDGLILLHDSAREGKGFTRWEVKQFLATEINGRSEYEMITIPFSAGLTILRKLA